MRVWRAALLCALLAVAAFADGEPGPTTDSTTVAGTTDAGSTNGGSTAGDNGSTAPPAPTSGGPTGGSSAPTAAPGGDTPAPTAAPVTDDGNTGTTESQETTQAVPTPALINFVPICDGDQCTYTMQVPALDMIEYETMLSHLNDTQDSANAQAGTDVPLLATEVDGMLSSEDGFITSLQTQLDIYTAELNSIDSVVTNLKKSQKTTITYVNEANNFINVTLQQPAYKNTCYFRNCIAKIATTTTSTTQKPTTTTPKSACQPDSCYQPLNTYAPGCKDWYGSYQCTCTGNLDGSDKNSCKTSLCAKVSAATQVGWVVSPGYNVTDAEGSIAPADGGTKCSSGASWVLKSSSTDSKLKVPGPTSGANPNFLVSTLKDKNSLLNINVDGKYKLQVTKSTTVGQINSMLGKGSQVTITWSNLVNTDYFAIKIEETMIPTTTTSTTKVPGTTTTAPVNPASDSTDTTVTGPTVPTESTESTTSGPTKPTESTVTFPTESTTTGETEPSEATELTSPGTDATGASSPSDETSPSTGLSTPVSTSTECDKNEPGSPCYEG